MFKTFSAMSLTLLAAHNADASTLLKFEYTTLPTFNRPSDTFTGAFLGELSPDKSTFNVSELRNFTFNNIDYTFRNSSRTTVQSYDYWRLSRWNEYDDLTPTATIALDKSRFDAVLLNRDLATGFIVGNHASKELFFGNPIIQSTLMPGGMTYHQDFKPENLKLAIYEEATLNFSYTFSDPGYPRIAKLSGTMSGWVSSDGSVFEAKDMLNFAVDGADQDLTGFRLTPVNQAFIRRGDPNMTVRLDKSEINLYLAGIAADGIDERFLLGVGESFRRNTGFDYDVAGASYRWGDGGTPFRAFNPANLTLSVNGFSAAVPEPASWAMMIAGFGLVGGTMRRRARHQTMVAA